MLNSALVFCWLLKNSCQYKNVILTLYKHVLYETAPKVNCFDGFCHHRLAIMSVQWPLFKSGMKTGLLPDPIRVP